MIRYLLVPRRSCLWSSRIGRWLSCLWLLVLFWCLSVRSIGFVGFQLQIPIILWFRFIILFFGLVPCSSVDHAVPNPIIAYPLYHEGGHPFTVPLLARNGRLRSLVGRMKGMTRIVLGTRLLFEIGNKLFFKFNQGPLKDNYP